MNRRAAYRRRVIGWAIQTSATGLLLTVGLAAVAVDDPLIVHHTAAPPQTSLRGNACASLPCSQQIIHETHRELRDAVRAAVHVIGNEKTGVRR